MTFEDLEARIEASYDDPEGALDSEAVETAVGMLDRG